MTSPAEPGDTASYQLKRFTEATDRIRTNATTAAKALGGLGSAVVAAVGVAKFSDIFPLPGSGKAIIGACLLAILVLAGFAAMGYAVLQLTGRIWKVSEPIFTTTDPQDMATSLTPDELADVKKVYSETVELNKADDVNSLKDYEAKAIRLEKDADAPTADRAALLAQATGIRNDIRATQARAAALIVRKRAATVGTFNTVGGPVILFAVGLAVSSLSADGLDAWRTSADTKVATAKACADAMEARVKNNISLDGLPAECTKPAEPADKTASPKPHLDDAVTSLSKIYTDCRADNTDKADDCAWIVRLINKATG